MDGSETVTVEAPVSQDTQFLPEGNEISSSASRSTNVENARKALQLAFNHLMSHIDSSDASFHKGLKKFSDQVVQMNSSQLSTALIKFGKSVWSAKQSASESIPKRAQRSKIGVQPSAVIRRKTNRKGKRALPLAKVHLFSLERYQQRKENVTWLKISAKTRAVLSRTMF